MPIDQQDGRGVVCGFFVELVFEGDFDTVLSSEEATTAFKDAVLQDLRARGFNPGVVILTEGSIIANVGMDSAEIQTQVERSIETQPVEVTVGGVTLVSETSEADPNPQGSNGSSDTSTLAWAVLGGGAGLLLILAIAVFVASKRNGNMPARGVDTFHNPTYDNGVSADPTYSSAYASPFVASADQRVQVSDAWQGAEC